MITIALDILSLFYKPEYIALLVAVVSVVVSAITVYINVHISNRNREYALAKEEYFKLRQMAERIISKLLILEKQRLTLKHFFELSFSVDVDKNKIFIDANDTFNRANFEKDGEEITTFIYLYFNDLGEKWNVCMDKMSDLFTRIFILNENIKASNNVDWKKEADAYNKASQELGNKPQEMAGILKQKIIEFKKSNL